MDLDGLIRFAIGRRCIPRILNDHTHCRIDIYADSVINICIFNCIWLTLTAGKNSEMGFMLMADGYESPNCVFIYHQLTMLMLFAPNLHKRHRSVTDDHLVLSFIGNGDLAIEITLEETHTYSYYTDINCKLFTLGWEETRKHSKAIGFPDLPIWKKHSIIQNGIVVSSGNLRPLDKNM